MSDRKEAIKDLRDNLTINGKPRLDVDEICWILDRRSVHDYILSRPSGMQTRTVDFYQRYGREAWKDVKEGDDIAPNVYFRLSVCLETLQELIALCEQKGHTKLEVSKIAEMLNASAS